MCLGPSYHVLRLSLACALSVTSVDRYGCDLTNGFAVVTFAALGMVKR